MTYRVEIASDMQGLTALEEGWTELVRASDAATIFASFQWNAAWWRHFGAGMAMHVAVAYQDDRLVAVAPLMIRPFGPFRKLEFIGTGLSDFGDVLLHPEHEGPAARALIGHLWVQRHQWDLADLSEMPFHSPFLRYLDARRLRRLRVSRVPQTNCPMLELPPTWEGYVSSLPRKRRYYVNSFPKKFFREHDGQLTIVTAPGNVAQAVDDFYNLHRARWTVKAEELSAEHIDPHFVPFLQEVCTRFASHGWLRLIHLCAGDQIVASSINFLMNSRWNSYMKGFDPEWSNSRPGTVIDAMRIQQAIAEHALRFDFGRGDEAYKSGFGATNYLNTRLLITTTTQRSRAAHGVVELRNIARDLRNRFRRGTAVEAEASTDETLQ